ncbi:hypothetical protein BGX27_003992, partial [Mortierella sp. AM989]
MQNEQASQATKRVAPSKLSEPSKKHGRAQYSLSFDDKIKFIKEVQATKERDDQISIASIGRQFGIHSHNVALRTWEQRDQLLAVGEGLPHQAVKNISHISKRPMMVVEEALIDWFLKERAR